MKLSLYASIFLNQYLLKSILSTAFLHRATPLKKYDKKIDFIYLDAFDYYHGKHSTIRKERYKSKLNCEITNELCHKMHLECCLNLNNKFNKDGLLCFDDILDFNGKRGKGVLAIPYLKQQKYKLLQYIPHAMIFSPP